MYLYSSSQFITHAVLTIDIPFDTPIHFLYILKQYTNLSQYIYRYTYKHFTYHIYSYLKQNPCYHITYSFHFHASFTHAYQLIHRTHHLPIASIQLTYIIPCKFMVHQTQVMLSSNIKAYLHEKSMVKHAGKH